MIDLFSPEPNCYGHYDALLDEEDVSKGGKLTGKRWSVWKPWSIDSWISHLDGITRFGAMPLREDGTVRFIAADIDEYEGLNLIDIAKRLGKIFPQATLARSKSGGAHIYIFFSEDVKVKAVRSKMVELVAFLGLGTHLDAIFPKQDFLDRNKDERGTWINVPYHKAETAMNYCFDLTTGAAFGFEEWLPFALAHRVTEKEFNAIEFKKSLTFKSGPPCLEHIFGQGVETARNISLLNAGTFFKKSSMTNWEQRLQEANAQFENPLPSKELATIVGSLAKRDYKYQCDQAPLSSHCARPLCRMRRWGIAQSGAFPIIASLTKHNTTPPVWWVYMDDGKKMQINTDALQNQMAFQKACMEQLNTMPPMMERNDWHAMMIELYKNLTVIDVPETGTTQGVTKELIFDFLTSKATGDTLEDLAKDKPVLFENHYLWRMKDMNAYMGRRSVQRVELNILGALLHEMGCVVLNIHVGKTTYQVYKLKANKVHAQQESYDDPAIAASPL